MPFIRLAYASQLRSDVYDLDVGRIVAASVFRNCQNGITGCLSIDDDRHVVQILEGRERAVEALMERIMRDPRHEGVVEFYRVNIDRPAFRDWGMRRWSIIEAAAMLAA